MGGWHMHRSGGKLNTHIDYNIHPKLKLQRKMNIILYMNSNWQKDWGGEICFYNHDKEKNTVGRLSKKISPLFNRAVIFDTTQNSWHGLPNPIECPKSEYRKSLAIYYLTNPQKNADKRHKALFTPFGNQANDKDVIQLIKDRATDKAKQIYKKDK